MQTNQVGKISGIFSPIFSTAIYHFPVNFFSTWVFSLKSESNTESQTHDNIETMTFRGSYTILKHTEWLLLKKKKKKTASTGSIAPKYRV